MALLGLFGLTLVVVAGCQHPEEAASIVLSRAKPKASAPFTSSLQSLRDPKILLQCSAFARAGAWAVACIFLFSAHGSLFFAFGSLPDFLSTLKSIEPG